MHEITKKVHIDKDELIKIKAIEGDKKTRFIAFQFISNNVPINLTECNVRVYGITSKITIFNDLEIIDAARGKARLELTERMLTKGITKYQIVIFKDGGHLSSNVFELEVNESLLDSEALEGSNEFKAFENALKNIDRQDVRFRYLESDNVKNKNDILRANNISQQALSKAQNPVAALQQANYKIPLEMLSSEVKEAIVGNTSISEAKGLINNQGVEYPHCNIVRDGILYPISEDMKNIFLDIKLIGAKIGKLYKIEWLGNGYEGFGNPTYGFNLYEYDEDTYSLDSGSSKKIIFSRTETEISKPTDTIVTRTHFSKANNISITLTYDSSKIKNGFWKPGDTIDRGCIISKNCYIYAQNKETFLAVRKKERQILIKFKYNDVKNMVLEFNKLGINEITHLKKVGFMNENKISSDFEYTLDYEINTDWISPYGIKALDNPLNDIDLTTGGNHGTDGANGFKTATSVSTEVFFDDDNPLNENEVIYCNNLKIITKNLIMAGNTIDTSTGDGRNCLEEIVTYFIKNNTIYVTVELRALENIKLTKYVGIQASNQNYKQFYFTDVEDLKVYDITTKRTEFAKKDSGINCDRFILKKNNDLLIGHIDTESGLGNREYISDDSYLGLWSGTKAYLHCIKNKELIMNKYDVNYYSGGYTFQESYNNTLNSYRINNGESDIYVADAFLDSITYLDIPINDKCRTETLENKNANISKVRLSRGFQFRAIGKGFIKFKI